MTGSFGNSITRGPAIPTRKKRSYCKSAHRNRRQIVGKICQSSIVQSETKRSPPDGPFRQLAATAAPFASSADAFESEIGGKIRWVFVVAIARVEAGLWMPRRSWRADSAAYDGDPCGPRAERQAPRGTPATASKHARSPKIAAKAQRATQAAVRSPKVGLRSVAADSADSAPERRNDLKSVRHLLALRAYYRCPSIRSRFRHSLLNSAGGWQRLGRPSNFSMSLQNSQARGSPCS